MIEHEEAQKAKETLIKYLEQELCLECADIKEGRVEAEYILYLALKQEFRIIN